MDDWMPAHGKGALWAGAACLAVGAVIILVGLDVMPAQGERAPAWVIVAAGGAFAVAGPVLLIQAFGGASATTGELPASAPGWIRTAQWLLGLGIWALLATIGSWIAFGPGPRDFSVNIGGMLGQSGALIGHIAFGIGAVITWLGLAAVLVRGLKQLRRGAA
jgi:hypothetical protein